MAPEVHVDAAPYLIAAIAVLAVAGLAVAVAGVQAARREEPPPPPPD